MRRPEKSEVLIGSAAAVAVALGSWLVVDRDPASTASRVIHNIQSLDDEGQGAPQEDIQTVIAAGAPNMPCAAGEVIYGVQTTEPKVAITIDDGPSPETTLQNLDIARKYGAKLTFFFLASRLESPEGQGIALRALQEGHEIAVHSYSHTIGNPDVNAFEHQKAVQTFQTRLGFAPYAYRAPGLGYNDALRQAVTASGECFIDVTLGSDTKDWQCDFSLPPAAEAGIRERSQRVMLAAGAIVLMHDEVTDPAANGGRKRSRMTSPLELELLLSRAQNEGFEAVTVANLLASGPHITVQAPDNSQNTC